MNIPVFCTILDKYAHADVAYRLTLEVTVCKCILTFAWLGLMNTRKKVYQYLITGSELKEAVPRWPTHSKKPNKLQEIYSLFVVNNNFNLNHCLKLFEIANVISCFINRHAFCDNLLRSDEILTCKPQHFRSLMCSLIAT